MMMVAVGGTCERLACIAIQGVVTPAHCLRSVCIELKKVNLSKNELKTLDGLTYCTGLTFLNISENQVCSRRFVLWDTQWYKLMRLLSCKLSHFDSCFINAFYLTGCVCLAATMSLIGW